MIKEDIKEYERNSVYKGTEHKDYGRNASKCIDKTTGRKVIIREYNRSDFNTNVENGLERKGPLLQRTNYHFGDDIESGRDNKESGSVKSELNHTRHIYVKWNMCLFERSSITTLCKYIFTVLLDSSKVLSRLVSVILCSAIRSFVSSTGSLSENFFSLLTLLFLCVTFSLEEYVAPVLAVRLGAFASGTRDSSFFML